MQDDQEPTPPRRRRAPRWLLGAALAFVLSAMVITFVTGFPGPGPLRRYPARDLNDLADRINQEQPAICRYLGGDAATVDLTRSRVIVKHNELNTVLTADERAMLDDPTQQTVIRMCEMG